ncbi:MAG: WD40 repeat domain-containing protein, partial [Deltaproteobacteria bacterium]|nr:WD40 repeat domain-containing protein [Deltaproteobacteria bacterium]
MRRLYALLVLAMACGGGSPDAAKPKGWDDLGAGTKGKPAFEGGPWLDPDALPRGAVKRFGSMAFRQGGSAAAVGPGWVATEFNGARVWRADGKYFELPGVRGSIGAIGDDKLVYVNEGKVAVADLKGSVLSEFEAEECSFTAYFSPNGSMVACSGDAMRILRTESGEEVLDLEGPLFSNVRGMALSDSTAAFVGPKGGIEVYDLASRKKVRTIPKAFPSAIALTPNGQTLLIMGSRTLRAENARTGAVLWERKDRFAAPLRVSPDGNSIATTIVRFPKDPDATIGTSHLMLFSMDKSDEQREIGSPRSISGLLFLDFSADGKRLAAVGADIVSLYDLEGGTRLFGPSSKDMANRQAAVHGNLVATVGLTGEVRVWNARSGKAVVATNVSKLVREATFTRIQFIGAQRVALLNGAGELVILSTDGKDTACKAKVDSGFQPELLPFAKLGRLALFSDDPRADGTLTFIDSSCQVIRKLAVPRAATNPVALPNGTVRLTTSDATPGKPPQNAWYLFYSATSRKPRVGPKRSFEAFIFEEVGLKVDKDRARLVLSSGKPIEIGPRVPKFAH